VLFSYFGSANAALAFNGAKEIQKSDNPRLWRTVENLAITEGLPMPKVYIIQDPGLNAFATGRDPKHASVAITSGLLDALDDNELQGVMAHELAHVKNYDIRVSIVVFGLVAVVSIMADIFLRISIFGGSKRDENGGGTIMFALGIVAMILAPIVAALIQAAVSRKREYLADASGALTTRYPEGLASALEKIKAGSSATKRQNTSTAHLFFANPMKGKNLTSMFSTHPPVDERIAKLRGMGSKL
jgi:heat shock protein HtpX